jgi:hypothetical protein
MPTLVDIQGQSGRCYEISFTNAMDIFNILGGKFVPDEDCVKEVKADIEVVADKANIEVVADKANIEVVADKADIEVVADKPVKKIKKLV